MNIIVNEKRSIHIILTLASVVIILFILSIHPVYANDSNLSVAKAAFGLSDDTIVMESSGGNDIMSLINDSASRASDSNPVIVHVASGSYSVGCSSKTRYIIPKNVLFVAEDGVSFSADESGDSMIYVKGSLYGGTYNGSNKAVSVIKLGCDSSDGFSGINGRIENAAISNSSKNGITLIESNCRNAQIRNCSISSCQENGISIERDSHAAVIENCVTYNNGLNGEGSGINLSHSDVDLIKNCTITNNGDKGISTNSDPVSGAKQAGCSIKEITGCRIQGNKQNGVYIKPKCYLKSFTNNKVVSNKDGIVANGKTAAGTTGTSYIKNIKDNTFIGNTNSNIGAQWSGATVYVSDGNVIKGNNKSANNIIAFDRGVVKIIGNNNKITTAKGAGISASGSNSKLYISGEKNKIFANKTQGIYAKGKNAVVTISGKGNQIYNNKKMGIAVYDGVKFTGSGANTILNKNTGAGFYAVKSKVELKGANLQILKSMDMGLIAKGSTVKCTGSKLKISNNKKAGIGIYDKTNLTITGNGSSILNNSGYAIYAKGKGTTATLKKVKLPSANKKGIYTTQGAKVKK